MKEKNDTEVRTGNFKFSYEFWIFISWWKRLFDTKIILWAKIKGKWTFHIVPIYYFVEISYAVYSRSESEVTKPNVELNTNPNETDISKISKASISLKVPYCVAFLLLIRISKSKSSNPANLPKAKVARLWPSIRL